MNTVLAIAAGGAVGAIGRHFLNGAAATILGRDFPFGILIANVLGSLLIGVLFIFFEQRVESMIWRQALIVGFLGSLTTFSTFSLDSYLMIEGGHWVRAFANVGSNVMLCIAAVMLGILIARAALQ